MKPRESALIPFCNVPPTRGWARLHLAAFYDIDYPHRPTHVFSAHFVLTRAHPGIISRSVTHPQIAPGQARLTSEFFGDRLPEKKLQLVGMNILLILLSPGPGCHILTPLRDRCPHRSIPSQERPLLATSHTSSSSSPCATSVHPVPTAHPRCPCTDPPRAHAHVGGICAPTRPCSCIRIYAHTCP